MSGGGPIASSSKHDIYASLGNERPTDKNKVIHGFQEQCRLDEVLQLYFSGRLMYSLQNRLEVDANLIGKK
jgi:hypothetical protein